MEDKILEKMLDCKNEENKDEMRIALLEQLILETKLNNKRIPVENNDGTKAVETNEKFPKKLENSPKVLNKEDMGIFNESIKKFLKEHKFNQ